MKSYDVILEVLFACEMNMWLNVYAAIGLKIFVYYESMQVINNVSYVDTSKVSVREICHYRLFIGFVSLHHTWQFFS